MNSLEEIYNKTPKFSDFSSHYMERLYMLSHTIPTESLNRSIELILKTARSNGVIYCLGNGGSSSTAEHFANDISMCPENSLYNLKAISLTSNIALYSAIANDHGFENVFAIQLQKFLRPQDLVVAFSASGNSSNIINAFEYAKELGCPSLGICGFDGGALKDLSDVCIHISSEQGEYGPVEDLHLILNHMIGNYLKLFLRNEIPQDQHYLC